MNLNQVTIIGRLTLQPEEIEMASGKKFTKFSLATNRKYTDKTKNETKEHVEYHSIVAYGRLGEICSSILAKGRLVYVQGRLQTQRWKDASDRIRTKTEVVAQKMLLLDTKQALVSAAAEQSPVVATEASVILSPEFTPQREQATVNS